MLHTPAPLTRAQRIQAPRTQAPRTLAQLIPAPPMFSLVLASVAYLYKKASRV